MHTVHFYKDLTSIGVRDSLAIVGSREADRQHDKIFAATSLTSLLCIGLLFPAHPLIPNSFVTKMRAWVAHACSQ